MNKILTVVGVCLLLAGCVNFSSPLPENYTGPVATIQDWVHVHSASKADFFYLTAVDGNRIEDSLTKTLMVNRGRGVVMAPVTLQRKVPAQLTRFKLEGRTGYAAPILAMFKPVYEVSGEIQFKPEAGHLYRVKGELGENYSAVWLEDAATETVVGEKIEIKGSAKLGILQK